ncbi:HU family DNA-binding protein [Pedobacter africanus]|uniref:DNA-binding protein HU-beta n=1 Tax=Pedobacter africanus TaxID=151894 RepID=A0A1W1Z8G9_9SPHI|nr:HU family DNA-binding protein [Pedobacter africanus]SMC44238.1 DNA-binding protein HU-beta [Pedobacter africanus]
MTKAEIVEQIAGKTGIERADVLEIVERFFKVVKESVTAGETIYIRGFGSFEPKKRAAKTARNISTNTLVNVPAHVAPKFKPAPEFVKRVKENVRVE